MGVVIPRLAVRHAAVAFAVISSLAVAACSPDKPVVLPQTPAAPVPPPPPPPPPMALNRMVTDTASTYLAYVTDASSISSSFKTPEDIQDNLKRGEAYEPTQLSKGMVAYAAVVALQDPIFVSEVRRLADDPTTRATVISRLYDNPHYALALPNAAPAAELVVAALNEQAETLKVTGHKVRQAAYDVQKQKWSKSFVKDRDGRLSLAKTLSSTQLSPSAETSERLMTAAMTGNGRELAAKRLAAANHSQVIARGMSIAALAILGEANNPDTLNQLMTVPSDTTCLSLAKLNLMQCLSVSKPHYEDVFCLGQHAMADTAACISKSASAQSGAKAVEVATTSPTAGGR